MDHAIRLTADSRVTPGSSALFETHLLRHRMQRLGVTHDTACYCRSASSDMEPQSVGSWTVAMWGLWRWCPPSSGAWARVL